MLLITGYVHCQENNSQYLQITLPFQCHVQCLDRPNVSYYNLDGY